MNYYTFRITEKDNGYFFYFISALNDGELALEQAEFVISNDEKNPMCQYLCSVNFDDVVVEATPNISIMDVINKNFGADDKNMQVSQSYVSLIPPPKPARPAKREAKPKVEKEPKPKAAPKPKAKKGQTNVNISTDGTTLDMNK